MLVYIIGYGVNGFIYDYFLGEFYLFYLKMCFLAEGNIYFINESYYFKYGEVVQYYFNYCKCEGYIVCYIGFLVVDFYCSLIKGGIYFYFVMFGVYLEGKFWLLYECNLFVFIVEQAGGFVFGNGQCIMEIVLVDMYQCVLLVIGFEWMVKEVMWFLK